MSWRAVAVIGPGTCSEEEAALAHLVGTELAKAGAAVVTGGLGGVMEAASRGAFEEGGMTIGILPGHDPLEANPYVRVPIPTGLGEFRNFLVVSAAEAVIAVGGEWGTLSEIAMAMKFGKRVVGLGTWELSKGGAQSNAILRATDPSNAVLLALQAPTRRPS